jgi:phosphoribosylamine-glycine ligase
LKLLVVGSGAREHTIVWKLAQSPRVKEVFAAPGNAGTAQIAHNLNIPPTDVDSLLKAVRENKIDLTVVGPEAPLAEGIVDRFSAEGLPIFGASKAAAEIETSKAFAKELLQKYKIPCAKSASFSARLRNTSSSSDHSSSSRRTGWRRAKGSSSPSQFPEPSKPSPALWSRRRWGQQVIKSLSRSS